MAKKESGSPKAQQLREPWFTKLSSGKKDAVCILILYGLILLLFGKVIFGNMLFSDNTDTAAHEAWTKAITHITESEHVEPLWIPYVFSGMPVFATLILPRDVNFLEKIILFPGKLLFLNADVSWFVLHYFLMGLFMYLLARQLKFSHLASLVAAITLMFNPYSVGLALEGHGSKLITLSYLPLAFLLTHNLFQKRDVLSLALLSAVIGTVFLSRHPQMAFYCMLIIGCYLVYEILLDIKQQPVAGVKKAALFVVAVAIGFAIYSYEFFPTKEYADYSIRGGSETGVSKGLDYDYATLWSFHPYETLTYIIPSFFGFSSQYSSDWQGQERDLPLYWGWMPFTIEPVYIGIVPLMLGILALIYKRNRLGWFLAAMSFLALMISFGKHFSIVYNLFFNYFPYFNKFRNPVLILYLIPFTFGLLAAQGADVLFGMRSTLQEVDSQKLAKRCTLAVGVLIGLAVIGFLAKSGIFSFLSDFMFVKEGEARQYDPQTLNAIKEKRFDLLWNYYLAFTFFSSACLGLIASAIRKKIHPAMMAFGFVALVALDLYFIDIKYIKPVPANALEEQLQPDATIQRLQAESEKERFRLLPVQGYDQQNLLMYFLLESVEGYSPAKLKIYQDVRDSCFTRGNTNVFNMLNVKYLVGQKQSKDGTTQTIAQLNTGYLPRAWFVDSFVVASSKEAVFSYLNSRTWNPKVTAILEKNPAAAASGSDSGSVAMTSYTSRDIQLTTVTSQSKLLVLSEVYYPAGWKALIDGTETEIYKTNYILRSVIVPAGKHTVEFTFDPPSYQKGFVLSESAWGVTVVLLLIGLYRSPAVRKKLGSKIPPSSSDTSGSEANG